MSAEWIAVVVAIIAVGVAATVAVVSGFRRLDDRIRGVENELAYLRGLLTGSHVLPAPQPEPPATTTDRGAA